MEAVEIRNSPTTSNSEAPGGSVHIRGVPLDDVMQAFLRGNIAYYRPLFLRMERQGLKFHPNLVSFLFTPVWLIYRKFFVAFGVFYALPIFVVLASPYLGALKSWSGVTVFGPFAATVLFCCYGNYFLYRRFRRLITDPTKTGDALLEHVKGKGGTSRAVLYAASTIFAVLLLLAVINPPGSLQ